MIPLGLVLTMVGIVFSAGVLYNKVDTNEKQLSDFKADTRTQLLELNKKVDRLVLIWTPAVASADDTRMIP